MEDEFPGLPALPEGGGAEPPTVTDVGASEPGSQGQASTPPAGQGQPPGAVDAYLQDSGVTPEQAIELMRQAQWLQGPEGKAHLYRQLTEQYAEELNGKRREVFGQELQQLLQHPQGRKIIEAALGDQRSAPGPEAELDSEMIDPGVRKMLLQQQQAIQQITQQNQQLAQQLQGLGQAHTSQALLQSSANELDGFVTANPVVMPFQRELAGDVYRAMQANPRAFAQRGAVTAFAKERATEYMRVARSMGAPVNGPPRGGPSGRGGQRGGLPALPAPKTEDEAVSQILTVYDSIRGGG